MKTSDPDNILIVFIKNPVKGQVKTRLAATMGEDRALAIYQALLTRTRQVCAQAATRRWVFYSDWTDPEDAWASPDFERKLQLGRDLGRRMYHAFVQALNEARRAVIIGSDCPLIEAAHLEQAFSALDQTNLVIGPSEDGGYYLLGMSKPFPELFEDIAWSTPQVLEQTLSKARMLGLSCTLLPVLPDIDHESDWERYGWPI